MGDFMKQRPQQPAPGSQHDQQRNAAFEYRAQKLRGVAHCPVRHARGSEGQERDEGDVLGEQDRDGEPAVRAIDLGLLGELAHDDRRRGHRDRAAEHDCHRHRDTQAPGYEGTQAGGDQDLRPAQTDDLPAHRNQAREREFQPQREHQEHDADLGQYSRGRVVGRKTQCVRSQQHADCEVAEDRRQLEPAHGVDDQHRCRQEGQNLRQWAVCHRRKTAPLLRRKVKGRGLDGNRPSC